MYYGLSMLCGALIALSIVFNGQLAAFYGTYSSTILVHIVGMAAIVTIMLIKRASFRAPLCRWYLYSGGLIGLFTVVFNSLAFRSISVSVLLAIGLLGQTLFSLVIDQFGLFDTRRQRTHPAKAIGIALVLGGIIVMLDETAKSSPLALLFSLITGFTIVLSRTVNAKLSERTTPLYSTWMNYVVGLASAVIAALLLGRGEPLLTGTTPLAAFWPYLGGAVGCAIVLILNLTVLHISAFSMTLLLFVGQLVAGLGLDWALEGFLPLGRVAGGVLVAMGLIFNLWIDRRRAAS